MLPDLEGLEAVKAMLALAPDVPLVVLSAVDDERLALEAVLNGAQDYLIKGQGDAALLRRAIRHAIERKRVERELSQLAKFDPLTGLPNRLLFRDRLAQAVQRIDRRDHVVALIFIDLDGFKAVNDRYGHAIGDRLLKAVAGRLCRVVRRTDTVAPPGRRRVHDHPRGPSPSRRRRPGRRAGAAQPSPAVRARRRRDRARRQPGRRDRIHATEIPDALTRRADAAMYRAKAAAAPATSSTSPPDARLDVADQRRA